MTKQELDIIGAMELFGGSFVKALAVCFKRADEDNFWILRQSFDHYWVKYSKYVKKDK
jgi:hypothetical protein